jgi:outer membrane protein OmpA-like peptidoglycan-associated protein
VPTFNGADQWQYQTLSTRFETNATVNPDDLEIAFKPRVLNIGDYTTSLAIENAFYYSTFGAGVVTGACTNNAGIFDCGGGVTVTTSQQGGAPYGVSVSVITQVLPELSEGNRFTPYTSPFHLHNTDLFATTIRIRWTSFANTDFNNTLSVVHVPAGKINLPSVADQAKVRADKNTFMFGYNTLYTSSGRVSPAGSAARELYFNSLQTLTWEPVKTLPAGPQTALAVTAATDTGGTPIRYVKRGGTSDCTVDSATGAITYTSTSGTCTVIAITNGDATYDAAQKEITFEINSTPGVTFTTGTGSGTAPTVPVGDVASMPDGTGMVAPAGHSGFSGWSCNDGTSTFDAAAASSLTVTTPTTCVAQWTPYVVSFGLNGGSGTAHANMSGVITMPDDSVMIAPAGKYFGGFTCTPPGSVYQAGDSFTPTANTTCLPVWTSYAVTFDVGTGSGTAPGSTSGVVTLPGVGSMVAPANHVFGGWECAPGGYYAQGATLTPTAATNCSATWNFVHTATFNAGAGSGTPPTVAAGDIASLPGGTGMTPPAGHGAFSGWLCNDGTNTVAKAAGSALNVATATTCAAQWTPYVITFGLNGGSGTAHADMSGVIEMPDGSGMTAPAGKFFGGYTCTPPGSVYQPAHLFTPTANTNCLPVWTGYGVSFDAGTGSGTAPSSATGVTTLPGQGSLIAPTGYGFAGWSCVPGGTYEPGSSFTPTAATQCSAVWELIHTVTFNVGAGSGSAPADQSSPILSLPGVGSMVAPSGDQFKGWACTDGSTVDELTAGAPYEPAADAVCDAMWEPIPPIDMNVMVGNKSMTEGAALPAFTTNSTAHLSTLDCGVYAAADTGFAAKLNSADLVVGSSPYVIHCTVAAASGYRIASYQDGVLVVKKAPVAASHKLKATYYFDGDSSKLRAATIVGLKALAKKVTAKAGVDVKIIGFVKRTNDTSYDYRLSLQRAKNIAAYLKKLGVKASYSVDSHGIAKENNPTARRAEVTIIW